MTDWQIAADTLREDISTGDKLVTVHADDVRAVLDELARLQAMERRAQGLYAVGSRIDLGEARGRFTAARYILDED